MRNVLILLATTSLGFSSSSCVGGDVYNGSMIMPISEPEFIDIDDFSWEKTLEEMSNVLKNPDSCSDCREIRGTFMAYHEMHYGYKLYIRDDNIDDIENIMTPIFIDKGVREEFDQFFSNNNMEIISKTGKRIYCDCVGYGVKRNGAIFYRIREARLFAR